ncbi:pentapeptide repeat-containing protein [Paenibacillus sp. FSL R7-0216]|uniref:pentapeptide repeat-containing protein n=1 Tax=Paenibacillus sp. FSL R7-0216 TaxID=2921677 RepID=UPI0030DC31A7
MPQQFENGELLLEPNMFIENADVRQSTWHKNSFAGSNFLLSDFNNCQLLRVKITKSTFAQATLDDVRFLQCDIKNIYIEASKVEGLVINGFKVDDILRENGVF